MCIRKKGKQVETDALFAGAKYDVIFVDAGANPVGSSVFSPPAAFLQIDALLNAFRLLTPTGTAFSYFAVYGPEVVAPVKSREFTYFACRKYCTLCSSDVQSVHKRRLLLVLSAKLHANMRELHQNSDGRYSWALLYVHKQYHIVFHRLLIAKFTN